MAERQRKSTRKKWLLGLTVTALVLAAGGAVGGFFYVRTSLPQLDGNASVSDIANPIEIIRDSNDIPHIFAKSSHDAYFALGYVHAQDRLWQLEMNRRIGSGRLAEVFGPDALEQDKFLRTLGIRRTAAAIYKTVDAATRERLEAYAAGINSFLKARTGSLPPEFLIARVKPEPWTPEDSIAWQLMMAWDLSGNWGSEILRFRLSKKLTTQQIQEFLPPYPGDSPTPLPDLKRFYANLDLDLTRLAQAAPVALPEGAGSNNWVVSGNRTESGKPLLANDPHLALSAPSIWYFAHLDAPDLKTIGATLPGLPTVILGRNEHIAWGFTNTGPDTQDLFIERVDPANPANYFAPDGSTPFSTVEERIKVKGNADVVLKVRISRHGPIISDVTKSTDGLLPENFVLAFSWAALRDDDRTIISADKITRAKNWSEFVEAVKTFDAPQQNIVYGDVEGNIGFIAPGRIPMRKPENDLHGLVPAPGWVARYDWAGFIPFEELPKQFNPSSRKIVTANQKIVSDRYPHFLTSEWVAPFRANRIDKLLDVIDKHSIESFEAIQADVISPPTAEFLLYLKAAQPPDKETKRLFELLNKWDGEMLADRAEPLIFHAWLRELTRLIYQDELGDMFPSAWDQRSIFVLDVLSDKNGEARWCDNINTPQKETCDDLVTTAIFNANRYLKAHFGHSVTQWHWGKAHQARSAHRPFSGKPIVGSWFDITVPSPGDTYTINVGRNSISNELEPFTNRHAASLRAIYDFADLDRSVFMHSTGQSGNRMSPFYNNFAKSWGQLEYMPMTMKRNEIEKNKIGVLKLSPR
ncbi:MAG: penicillin acylase family protein [Pseudomonadota bacterium]